MKITGAVHKYGDNINTDVIIPARYLNSNNPSDLACHCMQDIDANFSTSVKASDILVGLSNFGCGSSREHAPIAIKACGISCVIACSFSRIFYRNCINIGLPIVECPAACIDANDKDILLVNFYNGIIINKTQNKSYDIPPLPDFINNIIKSSGLLNTINNL